MQVKTIAALVAVTMCVATLSIQAQSQGADLRAGVTAEVRIGFLEGQTPAVSCDHIASKHTGCEGPLLRGRRSATFQAAQFFRESWVLGQSGFGRALQEGFEGLGAWLLEGSGQGAGGFRQMDGNRIESGVGRRGTGRGRQKNEKDCREVSQSDAEYIEWRLSAEDSSRCGCGPADASRRLPGGFP